MVSQRQRLARKRYKEAHPDEFPKTEPTPPKNPDKKKKKKSLFKRKKPSGSSTDKPIRRVSSSTRHPLRVPGMKPGEGCYICKATNHIAKLCPEKSEWERNKICLQCRRRGHSLKNCPDKNDDESFEKKMCYNCGDSGHSLSHCPCPMEDGGTKYASCFICKEHGHISKNCPRNKNGVYPMGGSCKVCGSVAHLVKDCPDKLTRDSAQPKRPRFDATPRGKANAASGMAVEDECKLKFLELKSKRNYRFIIFRIDGQQVVVEKLGSPEENYDDFTNSLPANECRYAVYDFDFTTNENCQKSKIFFIAWSPDCSRVRMKMVYASSKDRFKRELDGIQIELQATDPSEMSFDIIKSRAL
ncbi:unnamed protein product [Cochlearia groenlandica]